MDRGQREEVLAIAVLFAISVVVIVVHPVRSFRTFVLGEDWNKRGRG